MRIEVRVTEFGVSLKTERDQGGLSDEKLTRRDPRRDPRKKGSEEGSGRDLKRALRRNFQEGFRGGIECGIGSQTQGMGEHTERVLYVWVG